ncbi:MAG: hypothetical protein H6Q90_1842 [Deltaproteobacteria bacterium]|nr:hypothetical protein [Deltaproteobacteria bacterium]
MPGGLHVPTADTLRAGELGVSLLGGFGVRNTLLGPDHKLHRGLGEVAVSFAPADLITVALAFDGRYDTHSGLSASGDDGYVGDPHLLARIAKPFGHDRLGAQLGLWVPGKDAPSIAFSAISIEARVLGSIQAGSGTLGFDAGFRFDNSANSVENPNKFSAEDRVSLGVSDFNAVLAGAHFLVPAGKAYVGLEVSADLFVGSGAPGPILRGGATGGFHLNPQWTVLAFVEGAKVPGVSYGDVMRGDVTLIPYEPVVTGGVGLQARFGVSRARGHGQLGKTDKNDKNGKPEPSTIIEYAELTGQVTDEAGKPVEGAQVTVKLKLNTGSAVTDATGNYTVSKLPIGKTVDGKTSLDDTVAEISVEVAGKKPSVSTMPLVKGPNVSGKLALEPVLPPGTLKALIRAAGSGKPLANAVVTIDPGGLTSTADRDGRISIDLPPGTYKVTATIAGFKPQTLDVVIESGVVVKNFELPR